MFNDPWYIVIRQRLIRLPLVGTVFCMERRWEYSLFSWLRQTSKDVAYLSGGQPVTVGMHEAPIKDIAWIPEMNLLVTGSWDKTSKYVNHVTYFVNFQSSVE